MRIPIGIEFTLKDADEAVEYAGKIGEMLNEAGFIHAKAYMALAAAAAYHISQTCEDRDQLETAIGKFNRSVADMARVFFENPDLYAGGEPH